MPLGRFHTRVGQVGEVACETKLTRHGFGRPDTPILSLRQQFKMRWPWAPGSQRISLTSLGLVRPDSILSVHAERFPEKEKAGFWDKYKQIERVRDLPFEPEEEAKVQPIRHPDFRFKIRFCSGERDSDLTVFDWEIDALYFKQIQTGRSQQQARDAVIDKIQNQVCDPTRDTHSSGGIREGIRRVSVSSASGGVKRRSQLTFDDFMPPADLDTLSAG